MTPDKQPGILAWAKNEAERLRRISEQSEITDHFGYSDDAKPLAAAALDILRRHASGTAFLRAAEGVFHVRPGPGGDQALRRVADVLESWVQFVEEGLEAIPPFPVRARMEAATDLMEQVQQLLDDSSAHPAAAVVLAGAALEEFLRSQVSASNATVNGRPSISAYASALRSSGYFSAQDVKDVTAWVGQRTKQLTGNSSGYPAIAHRSWLTESTCSFDRRQMAQTSMNHLIRRLCRAHPLPAHSAVDLPRRYSLVRRTVGRQPVRLTNEKVSF
jgi:hypothetical protein